MPIQININGITYNLSFNLSINLNRLPSQPRVVAVTFRKDPRMSALIGTVHLTPLIPSEHATSRPVSIVVTASDGTVAPAVVVDMIDPAATFTCNDGDSVTATPEGDLNAFGQSEPGDPFTVVAAATITAAPTIPQVTGVSFVDAATASAAKVAVRAKRKK